MNRVQVEKHIGTLSRKRYRRTTIVLLLLILAAFVGHLLYVYYINSQQHIVNGIDSEQETYMDVAYREGEANAWLKRDFCPMGSYFDIWGQTIDCTLYNNASILVDTWTMRINIKDNCYVNKAWNGTLEIHQYVGTAKEKVQTLNLLQCAAEDVKLECTVDRGDIMIPLQPGDYIIYLPSTEKSEEQVQAGSNTMPGIIFYYTKDIDLSDYTLEFYYRMKITDGVGFIAILVMLGIFLIVVTGWIAAEFAYSNAEQEIKYQNGIASMSDIYSIIYYIDIEKDELIPVYADEESEKYRPKDKGAREQLLYMTSSDAEEEYLKITQDFIDISTVGERLEKGSIACEYISKTHGWTLIRFFPTERVEGETLKKVIFAIQDINEEKVTLKRYEDLVEKEKYAKNTYLAGLSGRTGSWLSKIEELNSRILSETKEEDIRKSAKQIKCIGKILSYTIEGGNDASKLAIDTIDASIEEYSADEVLSEFFEIAETMVEGTPVKIEKDISPVIPKKLKGDVSRIRRVLIQLLSDAVHYSEEGSIRFALYGKTLENKVHLLFSIKDSGGGISEERLEELNNYIEKISHHGPMGTVSNGHGLEVAACILAYLNSRLNVISTPGVGTEFYFEIDQEVVGQ